MDSMLLSSGRISSSTPLPLVLSYSSSALLEKKSISAKTHLSFPIKQAEKTPFLGRSLVFDDRKLELDSRRNIHLPFHPIKAAVKRRKELPLDNVIQRDKKLKLVLKIRKILVGQPDRIMSVKELGRFKRDLGIPKKRRLIALLKRFPAIFEIVEEGVYLLQFKLTPEADRLYLEELRVRNEMEGLLVTKLRKLLMMSLEKRVILEKIAHLRTDFGLPLEFRDTICQRYPQYFKIVKTDRGPALELTSWDPELAVSAAELSDEENRAKEIEERNLIIDRPPKFKRVKLPKGLNLSKGDIRRLAKFREIPYISPYSDFTELKAGTLEKEKHACGVVHEILSLTVEKRTLVDHFTHFREEFRFSQQLRGMLIRHPDMFYVSLKGERDSVFLREAYRDSHLIDKDRLLLIKEKMRALVAVPRFPNGRAVRKDIDGVRVEGDDWVDGNEVEDGDSWSDVDNAMSDGLEDEFGDDDDDEYGDEDDWSNEEDEMPPDFDDGGILGFEDSKPVKHDDVSKKVEEKVLVPVFPDGKPRERW
eukprot:TRINITY_DN4344_c0_g1_i1.p1 TRINITY_DN4344_c0_g1~~TRINITY_DN4344_c0_g1_i1.p1  ORF type:complete len:533 (+),score=142.50 TRINITY_DN4344_c0_g1_i1:312-1910(+)